MRGFEDTIFAETVLGSATQLCTLCLLHIIYLFSFKRCTFRALDKTQMYVCTKDLNLLQRNNGDENHLY